LVLGIKGRYGYLSSKGATIATDETFCRQL
jgi:hypothetical protein